MSENKAYAKGSVIFKENSWELAMYNIVSGKVGIYSNYEKEGETLLTELEAGKFFGEMGLIDAMPRSATAVALEDTVCEYITVDTFDSYLDENPEKVLEVFQNLCGRLTELSQQYIDSCETVGAYIDEQNSKRKGRQLLEKIAKLVNESMYYAGYADLMGNAYVNADILINYSELDNK